MVKITSEKSLCLVLSQYEAQTLFAILDRVGGSSELSRRGRVDCIRRALYECEDFICPEETTWARGSITFNDNDTPEGD